MSHNNLDTDMAVPSNIEAISEYYKNNMKSILKRNSLTNSSESISSTTSSEINAQISKIESNQNEVSIQNCTSQSLSTSDTPLHEMLYNNTSNINSVAVSGSSDVHFGNKFNYNGPVTIKQQIVIRDEEKSYTNAGFKGSQGDLDNEKASENDKHFIRKHRKIFFAALTVSIAALISLYFIFFFNSNSGDEIEDITIVPREAWKAEEPKTNLNELTLPVDRYIIAHTVGSTCLNKSDCLRKVKNIQYMHMNDPRFNFDDIGYNFLIGGDGNVYEGRGWKYIGAHTASYNRLSIGVAFMGNFTDAIPNEKQLSAGFSLFEKGKREGFLEEKYKIYGALQFRDTVSPGLAFYEVIKTWDHWSEDI